jgi:tetratricopeptide (TPR) repeat protein
VVLGSPRTIVAAAVVVAAAAAVAVAGLAGLAGVANRPAPSSARAAVARVPDMAEPATYDAAVRILAERRALAETLADGSPESSSRHAQAAGYQLDVGQLTGDYGAYAAAERSLADAFTIAARRGGSGAGPTISVGPHLLRAQLRSTLHRFREATADLVAPTAEAEFFHDSTLAAETKALAGAAAFHTGAYDEGVALLREALALDPARPGHAQRLALSLAKIGGEDEALRLLDSAESKVRAPRGKAWLTLQRALIDLDHGRPGRARERLVHAQATFPGWWLVDEKLAELDAAEGRTDEATVAYRSLVARTRDPEFMDALARLLVDREPERARALAAEAHALYEERLVQLPEASYGHALEHLLRRGDDPRRTVDIAEKNRDLRPDGEARTRLAQAYMAAKRVKDAEVEMRAVVGSRWATAESFATAAWVFERSGDLAAAARSRARARELDPRADERIAWMVRPPR